MRTTTAAVALVLALPAAALAQIDVQVTVTAPVIKFTAPPPLVVVTPGIQVVPDFDDEVFFVSGFYWVRVGKVWHRTKDHRGGWVVVVDKDVPPGLAKIPPGKYKKWKGGSSVPPGHGGTPPGHDKSHGHSKGKGKK